MSSTSTPRATIPWLALTAAALQCIALALITILLVSPTPWESSGISLLTIKPATVAVSTTPTTSPISTNTTVPTASTNTTSKPLITNANTTTNAPLGRRQDDDAIVHATTPVSYEAMPSSGGLNASALNATVINGGSSTASQPRSDIQLRIGPLGVCFRSAIGVRSCSSARLAGTWQYTALQRAIDVATNATSQSINVSDTMPTNLSTYATALLSVIVVLTSIAAVGIAYVITLIYATSSSSSMINRLTRAPWHTLIRTSHWLVVACGVTVLIASVIQKYKLTNVKDTFNAASPASLAVAGFHGNPSDTTSPPLMVTLSADTGSGFGLAWIATVALLVSAWLQRVALRRRLAATAAAALLPQQRSDDGDDKSQHPFGLVQFAAGANESQSSITPLPPSYGVAATTPTPATLPVLRQAHEGNVRLDTKESPPFSRYHQHSSNNSNPHALRALYAQHAYPPPPPVSLARFGQPIPLSSPNIVDTTAEASEYVHPATTTVAANYPSRSPSPAPSYWTTPVHAATRSEWSTLEKQRERQFMAELRRHRTALSEGGH